MLRAGVPSTGAAAPNCNDNGCLRSCRTIFGSHEWLGWKRRDPNVCGYLDEWPGSLTRGCWCVLAFAVGPEKQPTFREWLAFLVDAQAVLGALRCGRSSAPTLQRTVAQIASLALASGCVIKFVYIPSSHNSADAPSRGAVNRSSRAKL